MTLQDDISALARSKRMPEAPDDFAERKRAARRDFETIQQAVRDGRGVKAGCLEARGQLPLNFDARKQVAHALLATEPQCMALKGMHVTEKKQA